MMWRFLFTALLFSLIGCQEESVPVLEVNIPPGDKAVLIEDFTGVMCPNCPKGARAIDNFKAVYGSHRIISLAVYTNLFHEPFPESKYVFTTEKAQIYQDNIDLLIGKPAASFNRTLNNFNERFYLNPDNWQDPVIDELERESEVNLSMSLEYSNDSRQLSGEFRMVPIDDIDETLNYTIVIAENKIIDPQLDGPGIGLVLDYEHNHVLRDVLTAPEGDQLGLSFSQGEVYSESFTYTIPPEDGWWVAENCEIVAFVHLVEDGQRRVLQAISLDVVE